MSSHVYHELYVHLNWHTKADCRLLQGNVEEFTHSSIRTKAAAMKGIRLIAQGGTDDHVHLAVQFEPFLAISELVQEIKGASAREVNKRLGHKALEWQRGYGAVTFGARNLSWIVDYVRGQREHHASNRVFGRLETCDDCTEESGKPG